ncbi:MAG: hypothetical protein MR418_08405, partial [Clostridiales bacterium]|nr:hypothetical protein [Clostridiales bacterium]
SRACARLEVGNLLHTGTPGAKRTVRSGYSQSPLPSLAAGGTKDKGKNKRLSFKKTKRKKESKA